jgi:hypothetical protein
MPTITPADALIKAADRLVNAISGVIPTKNITKDAILQQMAIYRKQALDASDAESAQGCSDTLPRYKGCRPSKKACRLSKKLQLMCRITTNKG